MICARNIFDKGKFINIDGIFYFGWARARLNFFEALLAQCNTATNCIRSKSSITVSLLVTPRRALRIDIEYYPYARAIQMIQLTIIDILLVNVLAYRYCFN